jgi:hypothetical protein
MAIFDVEPTQDLLATLLARRAQCSTWAKFSGWICIESAIRYIPHMGERNVLFGGAAERTALGEENRNVFGRRSRRSSAARRRVTVAACVAGRWAYWLPVALTVNRRPNNFARRITVQHRAGVDERHAVDQHRFCFVQPTLLASDAGDQACGERRSDRIRADVPFGGSQCIEIISPAAMRSCWPSAIP